MSSTHNIALLRSKLDILQDMVSKNPNAKLQSKVKALEAQIAALTSTSTSSSTTTTSTTSDQSISNSDNQQQQQQQQHSTPIKTKINKFNLDDTNPLLQSTRRRTTFYTTSTLLQSPIKPDEINNNEQQQEDDDDEHDKEIIQRHSNNIPITQITNIPTASLDPIEDQSTTTTTSTIIPTPSTPTFDRRKSIRKSIIHSVTKPSLTNTTTTTNSSSNVIIMSNGKRLIFDSDSDDDNNNHDDQIVPIQNVKTPPQQVQPNKRKTTATTHQPQQPIKPTTTKQQQPTTTKSTTTKSTTTQPPSKQNEIKITEKNKKPLLLLDSDDFDEVNTTNKAKFDPQPPKRTGRTPTKAPKQIISDEFTANIKQQDQRLNDPFKAIQHFSLQSQQLSDDDDTSMKLTINTNTDPTLLAREISLMNKSPSKLLKNGKLTTNAAKSDDVQMRGYIPAFLDLDAMIQSLYSGQDYSLLTTSSTTTTKPSLLYLQLMTALMVNIPELDTAYSTDNNPKLQSKNNIKQKQQLIQSQPTSTTPQINFTSLNHSTITFNHFLPPFLRLKPLPHQVYSLFWLIAHERDHDYFLYRYKSTLTTYFRKLLSKRRQEHKNNPFYSLLTSDGIVPSDLPLIPTIEPISHSPLLAGDMLCDDCGLGKTYQLIALTASGLIARSGIVRGYEWIRSTLRLIQKKYLKNAKNNINNNNTNNNASNDKNEQLTPKQIAVQQYNNDPYVIQLSKILYECSLFLISDTDYVQKGLLGQMPTISPLTQLYIYVCSLFPHVSRNYIVNNKNQSYAAQHSILISILTYIGIDSNILPYYTSNDDNTNKIDTKSTNTNNNNPEESNRVRVILDSDSDDDTPQKSNPEQQQLSSKTTTQIIPKSLGYQLQSSSKPNQLPSLRILDQCPLCHDNYDHKVGGLYGSTLVVCVKSVMTQWEQEIKAICGAHPFPAETLYQTLPPSLRTTLQNKYISMLAKNNTNNNSNDSSSTTSFPGSDEIPLCNVYVYHANSRLKLFDSAWDYENSLDTLREKNPTTTYCSCSPRYSFVLTTYETLRSDYIKYQAREAERSEKDDKKNMKNIKGKKGEKFIVDNSDDDSSTSDDSDSDDEDEIQLSQLTLQDVTWSRIIFDESHKVKNSSTQNYKAAFELVTCNDIFYDQCMVHEATLIEQNQPKKSKGKNNNSDDDDDDDNEGLLHPDNALTIRPGGRHCVSATPLHNSVDDLHSIIKLLRFRPYNKISVWKKLLEKDKSEQQYLSQVNNNGNNEPIKTGTLWAIIQSCMIRRERTEKNDPKYTKLIQYLQTRQFQDGNDNNNKNKIKNLSQNQNLNNIGDDEDDLNDLLSGMSKMNVDGEIGNDDDNDDGTFPEKDEQDKIPTKSEWNQPFTPHLFVPLPIGPQTPDKPLFIKHFVQQTPIEQMLYDVVSKFATKRLQNGEEMSLNDVDNNGNHLDRIELNIFAGKNNTKKGAPSLTDPTQSKTSSKKGYSYANALHVLQLLQQCSSSIFLMTPNFIPLTFSLLRYNMLVHIEQLPDEKGEYDFLYGRDMTMKKPKEVMPFEQLTTKMLYGDIKLPKDDNFDSSDDEWCNFNPIQTSPISNGNRMINNHNPTKQMNKLSKYIDSDEEDDTDLLTNALSSLSINKPTSAATTTTESTITLPTTIKQCHQLFSTSQSKQHIYKKQPNRSLTLLQLADIYRRLLYNDRIGSPSNMNVLERFQQQVSYIAPKYTPHNYVRTPSYGFSSKMAYLMYLLTYLSFTQPGSSVLIFSSFTRTLDNIAYALREHSGYFNSYLHHYTRNATTNCKHCHKRKTIHNDKDIAPYTINDPFEIDPTQQPQQQQQSQFQQPLQFQQPSQFQQQRQSQPQPSQQQQKPGDTTTQSSLQLDLTYLDEVSTRTMFHSAQMSSYVSYDDTDLSSNSLSCRCVCNTCQYVRKRTKTLREKIQDDDDDLTLLRPHEELYLEQQQYSSPSILRCHCCIGNIDIDDEKDNNDNKSSLSQQNEINQIHSSLLQFKSFESITHIDGRQKKEEQEIQKNRFKTKVSSKTLDFTRYAIDQYENTHQCTCQSTTSSTSSTSSPINPSMLNNNHQPLPLNIMLISLKAGAVGLNLVEANHVVLFEANWNPMDRFQAMCRCIRNFQTKTVFVHELCSVGTIEEKVFKVRQEKRLLSKKLVESGSLGQTKELQMSLNELSNLLE